MKGAENTTQTPGNEERMDWYNGVFGVNRRLGEWLERRGFEISKDEECGYRIRYNGKMRVTEEKLKELIEQINTAETTKELPFIFSVVVRTINLNILSSWLDKEDIFLDTFIREDWLHDLFGFLFDEEKTRLDEKTARTLSRRLAIGLIIEQTTKGEEKMYAYASIENGELRVDIRIPNSYAPIFCYYFVIPLEIIKKE